MHGFIFEVPHAKQFKHLLKQTKVQLLS